MSAFGGKADIGGTRQKANLKTGFLVLDISGTPLRVRKAPACPAWGVGRLPDAH